MDVAKEFKAVNFGIKMKVRDMALDAEARIYGMDPIGYRVAVLRAQELTAAEEYRVAGERARSAMQQVGESYGRMYRAIQDMANDFAAGFQRALGQ